MAVPAETLRVELHGAAHAFPLLELRDRRKRGHPKKKWALVRATELLLFDVQDRSRGRFAAHLVKCSFDDGLLVAERAAVQSGVMPRPPPETSHTSDGSTSARGASVAAAVSGSAVVVKRWPLAA